MGQEVNAAPPLQQPAVPITSEDRLTYATGVVPETSGGVALPPELVGDPTAERAVEYVKANPANTVIEYRRVLYAFNAERLFNSIFGTQVELLEYLALHPEAAIPMQALAQFHDKHQKLVGSTEYTLRNYLNFLVSFGVISVLGPENAFEYKITQHGVEFLSYIKSAYPTKWNTRIW